MTNKIFKHIILSIVASTIVIIGLFMSVLYDYFGDQINNILKNETTYLVHAYESEGISYFESLNSRDRITLIDAEGNVLYDNRSRENNDNHLNREEVIAALTYGEGFATRRSDTIGQESIYYATLLNDGNILRVSTTRQTISSLLLGMSSHIFWIIVLVVIIAFLLAKRASEKIVKPINSMDINQDKIACYHELQPLVNKIQSQNIIINEQIEELRKRAEEFTSITENMQEGLIVINRKAEVLSFNNSSIRIFKTQNIQGKQSVFQFYHATNFIDAVNLALEENKVQNLRMDLDYKVYQILISPVNQNGLVEGAVILIRDVTEIERQEKMRREFSANVSHELKTPLTSILGFAEIMKNGMVDKEDVKEIASDIYNEANRLINLINDTIHLSSLEDNNIAVSMSDFKLSELIEDIFHTLDKSAKKMNIELRHKANDISYHGIESVIEEVIYNLCDNAIRYGKENGYVEVYTSEDEQNIIIKVEDNGIGIPYSDQSRVFERFYCVDKSHSKSLGGTGLGLSIVKHGVLLHGGNIKLTSKVNIGSTFTITLPKKKDIE